MKKNCSGGYYPSVMEKACRGGLVPLHCNAHRRPELKRVLSLFLALAMLCAFVPVVAMAATSGDCGDNLTWTLNDEGTLTISGTGDMEDWSHYSFVPWYSSRRSIKSVIIGNGITSIGGYAFYDCSSLESVTIGNSVTSIGDWVFFGCSSLTNIDVSSNNSIYSSLDGVVFNKDKTELILCPKGKSGSYTIPDSVTSICDYAFYDCSSLECIIIPDSVTSIGESAFQDCSGLTSIIIPNSVKCIDSGVFYYCGSFTSIEIPDSVTSISDYAFLGCSSLTDLYYGGSEEEWNNIGIDDGNDELLNATIHYNSAMPTQTTAPTNAPILHLFRHLRLLQYQSQPQR